MIKWRLIDSGKCDAAFNMALDEAIAINVINGASAPTLRFYGWKRPSLSIGAFQRLADIDQQYCAANDIAIVRRPTGGRGILHDDEFTYSFSSRSDDSVFNGLLNTYRRLSTAMSCALQRLGLNATMKTEREKGRNLTRSPVCFQSTSYGEVSVKGLKLIGSAQKRWKNGFLQHGSIPYSVNHETGGKVFKGACISEKEDSSLIGLKDMLSDFRPEELKNSIKWSFEKEFNITLVDSPLSAQEQETALFLIREKYDNDEWTLHGTRNSLSCNNTKIQRKA